MTPRLRVLLALFLLGACAPRADHTPFVTPESSLTHHTLEAAFYRTLLDLGVVVERFEAYRYDGGDTRVPRALVAELSEGADGVRYCSFGGNRFRNRDGSKVMVLVSDGGLGVRGVIYDLAQQPRLSYTVFEGSSFRPLGDRPCT